MYKGEVGIEELQCDCDQAGRTPHQLWVVKDQVPSSVGIVDMKQCLNCGKTTNLEALRKEG